jgi:hypothetical protein
MGENWRSPSNVGASCGRDGSSLFNAGWGIFRERYISIQCAVASADGTLTNDVPDDWYGDLRLLVLAVTNIG